MNNRPEDHENCPHPNTPDWMEACRRAGRGEPRELDIYEDLSIKTIGLLHNHIPNKHRTDFMKVAESLLYGYFCTLAAQLNGKPEFKVKMDTQMINNMVAATVNGMGEMLAQEGLAMPRIARSSIP